LLWVAWAECQHRIAAAVCAVLAVVVHEAFRVVGAVTRPVCSTGISTTRAVVTTTRAVATAAISATVAVVSLQVVAALPHRVAVALACGLFGMLLCAVCVGLYGASGCVWPTVCAVSAGGIMAWDCVAVARAALRRN
jgi:hypothetical protein